MLSKCGDYQCDLSPHASANAHVIEFACFVCGIDKTQQQQIKELEVRLARVGKGRRKEGGKEGWKGWTEGESNKEVIWMDQSRLVYTYARTQIFAPTYVATCMYVCMYV